MYWINKLIKKYKHIFLLLLITVLSFIIWKYLLNQGMYALHLSISVFWVLASTFIFRNNGSIDLRIIDYIPRYVSIILGIYFTFSYHDLPYEYIDNSFEKMLFLYGDYLVVMLIILSIRIPSIGIIIINFIFYEKKLYAENLPFGISGTDWQIVAEVTVFLIFGGISTKLLRLSKFDINDSVDVQKKIIFSALGIYFSSYFFSGFEKITLNTNPFSWVVDNSLFNIIINADIAGISPLKYFVYKNEIYNILIKSEEFLETFTIFGELFAIFAVLQKRYFIFFLSLMTLMHLVIFIFTGIFFWKWVLFNFILFFFVSKHNILIPRNNSNYVLFCAFLFLGQFIFYVPKLGWYDSPVMNNTYCMAVNNNGDKFYVPSNYFNDYSITFAQQRFININSIPNIKKVGALGSVRSLNDLKSLNKTQINIVGFPTYLVEPSSEQTAFVINHHNYMSSHFPFNIDIYPHHIFSTPQIGKKFCNMHPKKITSYEFYVDTVFSSFTDNAVNHEILERYKCIVKLPP